MKSFIFLALAVVCFAEDQTVRVRGLTVIQLPQQENGIHIEAILNKPNAVYFEGEFMEITLQSNKNVFFKVYCLNSLGKLWLIYPNRENGSPANWNNRLLANIPRTIPEGMLRFKADYPFGDEQILIVASAAPLPVDEEEMAVILYATEKAVQQLTRGITLTAINGGDPPMPTGRDPPMPTAAQTTTKVLNYKVLGRR